VSKKDKTAHTRERGKAANQSEGKVQRRNEKCEEQSVRQRRGKKGNEEIVEDLIEGKESIDVITGERNGDVASGRQNASRDDNRGPSWRTPSTIKEEQVLEVESKKLWDDFIQAEETEDKFRCAQKISARLAGIKKKYAMDQAVCVTQQIIFCNALMSFNGLNELQEAKTLGHPRLTELATQIIEDVVPIIWSS